MGICKRRALELSGHREKRSVLANPPTGTRREPGPPVQHRGAVILRAGLLLRPGRHWWRARTAGGRSTGAMARARFRLIEQDTAEFWVVETGCSCLATRRWRCLRSPAPKPASRPSGAQSRLAGLRAADGATTTSRARGGLGLVATLFEVFPQSRSCSNATRSSVLKRRYSAWSGNMRSRPGLRGHRGLDDNPKRCDLRPVRVRSESGLGRPGIDRTTMTTAPGETSTCHPGPCSGRCS